MARLNYNLDDIPDVPVVPAGRYRARLVKVTKMQSTTDNPMLKWSWKIKGGKADKMQISSFTSLLPQALSGLKQHLIAFGLKGKISTHTDKLIGRMALLVIGKRKGRTKLGEKVEFSTILGVLPIDTKLKPEPAKKRAKRAVGDEDEDEDEEDEDEDEDEGEDGDEGEDEDEDEDEEDSPEEQWEALSKGARRDVCEDAELSPKLASKDWDELSAKQQKALEEPLATEDEEEEEGEDED